MIVEPGRHKVDSADGALDVRIADVAEDADEQEEVGRNEIREAPHVAGVGAADLEDHASALEVDDGAASEVRIELDGCADDVATPSMRADGEREVRGVAGAQGHDGQRSGRRRVEELCDRIDHVTPAVVQRVRGVLVGLVPSPPVVGHRVEGTSGTRDT
jgi:hypothetical protein